MKLNPIFATFYATLLMFLVVTVGCPQPGPVVPTPDATDGSSADDCIAACANLRTIGCVSARPPMDGGPYLCPDTMRVIEKNKALPKADGTPVTCHDIAVARDPRLVSMRLCL